MKVKVTELYKLIRCIEGVFQIETPPPPDLKRAFFFKTDMLALCNRVAVEIQDNDIKIILNTTSYLALLCIVGLNIHLSFINENISEELLQFTCLHSIMSVWIGIIYYATMQEILLERRRLYKIVKDFYKLNFSMINMLEPNLREKLREINQKESENGFNASWNFLMKKKEKF
jgi:hypothetical protein